MTKDQFAPDWFSKPGDSIRHLMTRRAMTPNDIAENGAVNLDLVRGLLDGSIDVDRRIAKLLETVLGGTSSFWEKRQANYEKALDRIVEQSSEFEVNEWLERTLLPAGASRGKQSELRRREEYRKRLVFYDVSNLQFWCSRYGQLSDDTQFRASPTYRSDDPAVALWLRLGELDADLIRTRDWSAAELHDRVAEIRKLSRIGRPSRFLPRLKSLCAEAGVAVVVRRPPNGCRVSGATKFVSPEKAMMLLSFRYRSDDQFWFTVFHEIGHLLLHRTETFIDDDGTPPDDQAEVEANTFARSCIVPVERRREFDQLIPSYKSIIRLGVSIGVSPGMIVGQMQYDQRIGHNQFNKLKRRWTWSDIESTSDYPLKCTN